MSVLKAYIGIVKNSTKKYLPHLYFGDNLALYPIPILANVSPN